jgi:integrase
VKAKSTDRGERTIAKYNTLSGILKEFEGGYGKLTFEAMTHNFYDAFKKFLIRKRKLTNNTVGKYVSTLKTFLAWAEERGASIPKDYRKFRVDEEDVAVIALSMDEVRRIENLDVSNHPRLNRVKDLFLFACYTGARFGDIQMLHIDDIHDTVWRLRMGKTRTETLIHLIPQAFEILNKYRRFGRMPQISSQRMNDYLKEIGKLAEINEPVHIVRYQGAKLIEKRGPKWQFLSSHIARKTFVTISLERGMRAEVVMSFTGHRNFKTLKRYIALTQQARGEAIESVWGGA